MLAARIVGEAARPSRTACLMHVVGGGPLVEYDLPEMSDNWRMEDTDADGLPVLYATASPYQAVGAQMDRWVPHISILPSIGLV